MIAGILISVCLSLQAQIPQGFTYQALVKNQSGVIANTSLDVKLGILSDTVLNTYVYEEQQSAMTNDDGLLTVIVGEGTKIQGQDFSSINWSATPLFLRVTVYYQGSWKLMGTTRMWSIPFSMVSGKTDGINPGAKLIVESTDDTSDDPLFEVKRKDGQTVFSVYPDAVNVYVPNGAKGAKGGFAIGGFDEAKGISQDYFRVTPDSIRAYISNNPAKGVKGGFAIGGYDEAKGLLPKFYMNINGANTLDTVKGSPQVLWYPNKNAFLAGNVHIGSADSVGNYSTALGYRSIAMGNYSQAFGYKAKAFGDYSTSIGKNSVAGVRSGGVSTASNAFAFGNGTKATGNDSYAFGSGAIASGYRSFAFGYNSQATAQNSAAFGSSSQATNTNSLALGNGSIASGTNSTAMGYQSQSQGDKSIAIGSYYSYSYAIPIINLTKGDDSGGTKGLDDFLPIRPITSLTTLTRTFNRANIASGQYSVAIGNGNLAQNGGFVFGSNSDAIKFGALAMGNSASASETNSIALGYNSLANGVYSVAIGNNITAASYGEIALGQWNESVSGTTTTWNPGELLFSLGNGVNSSNRSNALTVYKDGKTIVRGRYAVSTFNYKRRLLTLISLNPILFEYRDYIYGVYTNISRDDPTIEYYYSGYFGDSGDQGTYRGLYADERTGGSIDVAEYILDTNANTEAADVVVADPANKESVVKSSEPFQTSVVGVISTKPHLTMGMELVVDEKTGAPLPGASPSTRLALTGRVPVKVTGENGPIMPGDLLTTSSTEGHAMKWTLLDVNEAKDFDDLKRILAENEKRRNAVIGKAVESFSGGGNGQIMVLISLQ